MKSSLKSLLFTNITKEIQSPKLIVNTIETSIGNKTLGGASWIQDMLQAKNRMALGPLDLIHKQLFPFTNSTRNHQKETPGPRV